MAFLFWVCTGFWEEFRLTSTLQSELKVICKYVNNYRKVQEDNNLAYYSCVLSWSFNGGFFTQLHRSSPFCCCICEMGVCVTGRRGGGNARDIELNLVLAFPTVLETQLVRFPSNSILWGVFLISFFLVVFNGSFQNVCLSGFGVLVLFLEKVFHYARVH